ncbi:MAG: LCP family protein [Verrucomicrobiota bacterium]
MNSDVTRSALKDAVLAACLEGEDTGAGVRRILRRLFWVIVPVAAITLWLGVLAATWNRPLTLLLLGSDSRDGEPARSDAILVLRADPWHGTVKGLSLPRDLYVPLSGLPVFRVERLNAALFFGDYYATSEGIRAARQTVSDLIGVPVDGATAVRLHLLAGVVDALGGIEVYCEKPVHDPKFNPFKGGGKSYPLRFEAGWNHLNGERALEFARVRRPDTDFGRMSRNQQLLSAVAARLRTPGGLVRLPLIVPHLWRGIETDLGPVARLRMLWVLARCSSGGILWDSIDRNEVLPYVTARGAQVLLPEPGILKEAGRILTGEQPIRLAGTMNLTDRNLAWP